METQRPLSLVFLGCAIIFVFRPRVGFHIEDAKARPQQEDLLQSKIRSNHWYICMYSLSKYRQIYSASHVVCQDTLLWYCMLCNPTLIAPQKLGAFWGQIHRKEYIPSPRCDSLHFTYFLCETSQDICCVPRRSNIAYGFDHQYVVFLQMENCKSENKTTKT